MKPHGQHFERHYVTKVKRRFQTIVFCKLRHLAVVGQQFLIYKFEQFSFGTQHGLAVILSVDIATRRASTHRFHYHFVMRAARAFERLSRRVGANKHKTSRVNNGIAFGHALRFMVADIDNV
jgi:phosphoenolpyruvate synthase/pyruvate phosphate dikinase